MNKILTILCFLFDKEHNVPDNTVFNFGNVSITVSEVEYKTLKCIDLCTEYQSISIIIDVGNDIIYYTNRSRMETTEFRKSSIILDVVNNLDLSKENIDYTKLILTYGRNFNLENDIPEKDLFGKIIFERIDDFYTRLRGSNDL